MSVYKYTTYIFLKLVLFITCLVLFLFPSSSLLYLQYIAKHLLDAFQRSCKDKLLEQ